MLLKEELLALVYPATYLLQLKLAQDTALKVGALPESIYVAGDYYYVGSARRAAGHRLWRHWSGGGKQRWHIDYLRAVAVPQQIWVFAADDVAECALARQLQSLEGLSVIPGFGCSDCRCPSHLWLAVQEVELSALMNKARSFFRGIL